MPELGRLLPLSTPTWAPFAPLGIFLLSRMWGCRRTSPRGRMDGRARASPSTCFPSCSTRTPAVCSQSQHVACLQHASFCLCFPCLGHLLCTSAISFSLKSKRLAGSGERLLTAKGKSGSAWWPASLLVTYNLPIFLYSSLAPSCKVPSPGHSGPRERQTWNQYGKAGNRRDEQTGRGRVGGVDAGVSKYLKCGRSSWQRPSPSYLRTLP